MVDWGALQNPVGANMGSKIDQVAQQTKKRIKIVQLLGGPGTDLFPESIRIEVLMMFYKCMIDLGKVMKMMRRLR